MKKLLHVAAIGLIALSVAGLQPVAAQEVTSGTILNKLKPKKTIKRGLRETGLSRNDAQFLDSLPGRGIQINQRKKLAEIIAEKELPKIDVQIQFELDSAEISAAAHTQVEALGAALSDPSMSKVRIALNGHTDTSGTDEHNFELSEARAAAVRRVLVTSYHLDPSRLIAVGFGEERLKDTYDPESPVNRRVEVVRITQ
ncbi:MAG: oprF 2 [Rhizobium sp.]|nr:oprF 2 [Rhizobium sp.]